MKPLLLAAALAIAAAPAAAQERPAPSQAQVMELMGRRAAQGEVEGRVLQVFFDPSRPAPRTAQVTLECDLITGKMRACRVWSESERGLGAGLVSQSGVLWMAPERADQTVHVLFDIVGRTAILGVSDPAGVVILQPQSEREDNSGFSALDRDRNGRLTYEEASAVDANRNGRVDASEFDRSFRVAMGQPGRSFGHFDLDDDGIIYLEELQGAYRPQSIQDLAP